MSNLRTGVGRRKPQADSRLSPNLRIFTAPKE